MSNKKLFLFLLTCFLLGIKISLMAQDLNDFGFVFWKNLPVSASNVQLDNPWAGGVNNAQFGKIDLNHDGFDDLLLFDRHGDRLLPFLYQPGGNQSDYLYAPEYKRFFPEIKQWFQLKDYNADGLPDIFTYTPGGIMVYRNVSSDEPKFERAVFPYITSLQGSIFTNLLVTYVDYPAIEDLDNDGDLDILTFWGLGSYVELHRNMSVELYGNADSLVYHKVDFCWGRFAENPESNLIYLDTCFNKSMNQPGKNDPKHTGSTFTLLDMNGDHVLDLLLGDVDYSDAVPLLNGGDNFNAVMVEQLPFYPLNEPIALWSFPLTEHIDLENTGKPQLVVSPFDPGLMKSEGSESVWLYENVSVSDVPDFRLKTKSFIQNSMIETGVGSYPVFADVNSDGLIDLVVGNYGLFDTCILNLSGQLKCYYTSVLQLYLNTGTMDNPAFTLIDNDFANVSQLELLAAYPAFFDIDNDGDLDMLIGESEGYFHLFSNSAGPGNLPVFESPVLSYQNLKTDGYSAPVFIDIDKDGLADIVSGSASGKFSWFRNAGSPTQPDFKLITDFLGKVNVTDEMLSYKGYSIPAFIEMESGNLKLLSGSETGLLKYFSGISADTSQAFVLQDAHFMYLTEGIRTAPAWADLNHDGYPDLAIGNYAGGVSLYKGTPPGPAGIQPQSLKQKSRIRISPNPGNGIFDMEIMKDGEWQVELYSSTGRIIKKFPAKGFTAQKVSIEKPCSGIVFIKATATGIAGEQLFGKAVIIQ